MVHIMLPMKKHVNVFAKTLNGIVERAERGRAGLTVNAGRGPANWNTERRKI